MHADPLSSTFSALADPTRKDKGNLRYDVYQQKARPNHFTVVEVWTNLKAADEHEIAAHTKQFRRTLGAATGALYWFGLPGWAQGLGIPGMADEPDLVIELPPNQDHRELPDGTIYFAASGVIINPTDREQRVPPILAELRDAQGTIVYSWTIKPPVRTLPPNEKVNFSEAKLDIPRRATQLTVSWALPKG